MPVSASDVETVYSNLMTAFFDDSSSNLVGMPRIAPVRDLGSANGTGGQRDDTALRGPYWMMAQLLHFIAERAIILPGSGDASAKVKAQIAYLTSSAVVNGQTVGYTDAQFSATSANDETIHVSDDAAWKLLSYYDFHRITGDGIWLTRLASLLQSVLNFYADPSYSQHDCGDGVLCSPYGIEYAVPGQDSNGQERSTLYEVGLTLVALYLYDHTGKSGYLNYATYMFSIWQTYFKDNQDNPGAYWFNIHLKDSDKVDGTPLHQPISMGQEPQDSTDGGKRHPVRGYSGHSSGALMAVGALTAKLLRITKQNAYLQELFSIVSALQSNKIYVGADGRIVNDRDAWTNGFFACDFVREVLSQTSIGVDSNNALRNIFASTGAYVANSGLRSSRYYSADWGVPGAYKNGTTAGRNATWDADSGYPSNLTGEEANPLQIMTSANSALMVLAGYLASSTTGSQITDGTSTTVITDPNTGETLSDA